jgi:thiamine-phosphate diphosphorylase
MAMMPKLLGISPGDHGCGRTLTWIVQGAVDGGLRALILREPHLSEAAYVELARRLSPLLGPGLILHASHAKAAHIAGRAGWGLHMPSTADWSEARKQVKGWLGASCHTADDLSRAVDAGCDYVTLSPVFTPLSKPSDIRPSLGLDGLKELANSIEIPVFALGGINTDTMPSVVQTGVHGVGSMGFLFPSDADADVSTENASALTNILG